MMFMDNKTKSITLSYNAEFIDYGDEVGIVIPNEFLKQLGVTDKVNLTIESGRIVLSPC